MEHPPELVCFGPFRLDPDTLELWRGDELVPLEPLNARILLRLASNAGKLVHRRDLQELGWPKLPGAAEQSLNTAIHRIRRALEHDGDVTVKLETLRGRGYRISVTKPDDGSRPVDLVGRRARLWVAGVGVAAAAVLLVLRGPSDTTLPTDAQHALERAFYLAQTTGDLPAARAVLDSALARSPGVAALHAAWGELEFWLGDQEGAERGVGLALRLDPTVAVAHRTRGLLAIVRSDWSSAESALQEALRLDASDTRTLTALAYWRIIEGRFEEADSFIVRALRQEPLSTVVNRDAGILYLMASRYDKAEQYCGEALRFHPESEWATDCMFDIMVLQARTLEAATWGRRLVEISGGPDMPARADAEAVVARVERWRLDAWVEAVGDGADPYGLALALAANGRPSEALGVLQTAAESPTMGLLLLHVDPRLATLRGLAEFETLLERLQLGV